MTNLWVTFSTDISGNFTELSGNIIYNLNNIYNFNGNVIDTTSNFIIYELTNNPIQGDVSLQASNWNQLSLNNNLSPFQGYWLGGINTNLSQIFTSRSQLVTAIDNLTINPISVANNYGLIENWNVSNITDMNSMFFSATSFNGNISNWDVRNVTNMNSMFNGANTFNQDISNWYVGNVTDMYRMFDGATSFNQDISNWDVGNVSNDNLLEMFKNVTFFTDMNKLIYSNGTPFNYFISQRTSNILNIDGYYYYTVENYITSENIFHNDSALNSITPSSSYIFIILSKTEITDPRRLETADIYILTLNPITPIKFNNYIELSNNFNVDTYYYVYTTDNAIANTLQDSPIEESLQLQFLP